MPTAGLLHPHPAVAGADVVLLVEDQLFFRQYADRRQKLRLAVIGLVDQPLMADLLHQE